VKSRIWSVTSALAFLVFGGCAVSNVSIEMAAEDASTSVVIPNDGTCSQPCMAGLMCSSGQCCVPPASGGVCTQYPACGCPANEICYPVRASHSLGCFGTDNLAEGADCNNGQCTAGFGCFGSTCKQYCNTDADCPAAPGVRKCLQTTWSDTKAAIAGVLVCASVCDPVHPQGPKAPLRSCPAGFGCYSSDTGASGCYSGGTAAGGSTCASDSDCLPGFYCGSGSKTCRGYCYTDADCPGSTCSIGFSPAQFAGIYPVGYCN
jgi:hypothetical protein